MKTWKLLIGLMLLLGIAQFTPQTTECECFSIAVLPDTQKYSRYAPEIFLSQTQWIADNAAAENIVFTTHLGDLVDQSWDEDQWHAADAAMRVLDVVGLPYSVQTGNHDLLDARLRDDERDLDEEPFLMAFPPERFSQFSTYGGHSPSGFNSYHIFEGAGQEFLVLALDWRIGDESLQWAQAVLDTYADLPTILTTHFILDIASDRRTAVMSRYGDYLWENLIAPNPQIFLTINSHRHGAAHMIRQNDVGLDVLMMVVDYQASHNGGNGMMRVLTFDLDKGTIEANSFSPYVLQKPESERTDEDRAVLTDSRNQFTVEINIMERIRHR